ncbi:MAG: ABC transporter permease, partial [Pirellulales bacterium]|nr:ABC transporter permease [Pirellulales bacterium]
DAASGLNLAEIVAKHPNLTMRIVGPMTRAAPSPTLRDAPMAIGGAFGVPLNTVGGPYEDEFATIFVEPTARIMADTAGFAEQLEALRQEVGFALRALGRRKSFALIAIGTIGLGIGANTAIFSVVEGVLLRPLPFPEADRILTVGGVEDRAYELLGTMSTPEIEALEGLDDVFAAVAAFRNENMTLTEMGPAEMVPAASVLRGLFQTLGVPMLLGRDLTAEEAANPGSDRVVISSRFWQSRLGGDPDVIGQTLRLDSDSYEIVGVAPAESAWPATADLWVPGGTLEGDCWWGCHLFYGLVRLADGVSLELAQQRMDALAASLAQDQPNSQTDRAFGARTLHGDIVGDVRDPLWILLGAVGLVLLIACANVA